MSSEAITKNDLTKILNKILMLDGVDMTESEVTEFIDSLNLTAANTVDYIVEEGTSGIWTYRKWNSGIYECWGNKTASYAVNTSSEAYGGYRSGALNIDAFPLTLTEVPTITATVTSGSAGVWVNNISATTSGGTFYLSCGASQAASNRTISLYAIGRWK